MMSRSRIQNRLVVAFFYIHRGVLSVIMVIAIVHVLILPSLLHFVLPPRDLSKQGNVLPLKQITGSY